eukprot:CAMPEP_0196652892 /NCGR_PEP_ID=MMETSP1086-20130531/2360_1 /TAXON_ID=77921 /ORGANISM="Cyanoptyche  gloeocystis , Strain SAG4.97" /LENGTH=54 /DNA_ID=CAMNT_0041983715 /DNA_START=229 /DNA_END=391 /DNA_ORIENTATION=-
MAAGAEEARDVTVGQPGAWGERGTKEAGRGEEDDGGRVMLSWWVNKGGQGERRK